MKKLAFLALILVETFISNGQEQSIKEKYTELQIGDKLPDISLGSTVNNTTGKTRFSDFKGKLIILDFWNSSCTYCIELFPHMSDLQKQFGDKIQIFLVNPWQTEEEVKTHLSKSPKFKNRQQLYPANLPVLMGSKELEELFPHRTGLPYHVWIDGEGTMRLRGHFYNTHEEKIKELLAGKKISFVQDGIRQLSSTLPLYALLNKTAAPAVNFNSLLTPYNDQLQEGSPTWDYPADTVLGTVRTTFINNTVFSLYREVFNQIMKAKKVLTGYSTRISLLVKDTFRYTDNWLPDWKMRTDKLVTQCRFCYEQIVPNSLPDSLRRQYMLEDLNRYFSSVYGTQGKIEKEQVACWIVVRTSSVDKLRTSDNQKIGEVTEEEAMEKRMSWVKGKELNDALSFFFGGLQGSMHRKIISDTDVVIDETGYKGKVDMVLPALKDLKTIEDVKKALKEYDLDLIKEERALDMLIIKESAY